MFNTGFWTLRLSYVYFSFFFLMNQSLFMFMSCRPSDTSHLDLLTTVFLLFKEAFKKLQHIEMPQLLIMVNASRESTEITCGPLLHFLSKMMKMCKKELKRFKFESFCIYSLFTLVHFHNDK